MGAGRAEAILGILPAAWHRGRRADPDGSGQSTRRTSLRRRIYRALNRGLQSSASPDQRLYSRLRGEYHRDGQFPRSRRAVRHGFVARDRRPDGLSRPPRRDRIGSRTIERGPEMAQAVVNPEELRRFAAQLKRFNNEMITQLTTLHGQLSGLGQSVARPRARQVRRGVRADPQGGQAVRRLDQSAHPLPAPQGRADRGILAAALTFWSLVIRHWSLVRCRGHPGCMRDDR